MSVNFYIEFIMLHHIWPTYLGPKLCHALKCLERIHEVFNCKIVFTGTAGLHALEKHHVNCTM